MTKEKESYNISISESLSSEENHYGHGRQLHELPQKKGCKDLHFELKKDKQIYDKEKMMKGAQQKFENLKLEKKLHEDLLLSKSRESLTRQAKHPT
jgi:hypothetical protein